MKCYGFSSVKAYDLNNVKKLLPHEYDVESHDQVLSFRKTEDCDRLACCFSYGVLVLWGYSKSERKELITLLEQCSEEASTDLLEEDHFDFSYGDRARIRKDQIVLPDRSPSSKLAVSHAIAQSIKLGVFEQRVDQAIRDTEELPIDLAKKGRIGLSRKQIRQKMGQIYLIRSSINLQTDLLDEPEFFWNFDELEPFYSMVARYLDIQARVEVLNQRLEVVHELFDILNNELNHQHSARLEWTIIWLILIEVFISLVRI